MIIYLIGLLVKGTIFLLYYSSRVNLNNCSGKTILWFDPRETTNVSLDRIQNLIGGSQLIEYDNRVRARVSIRSGDRAAFRIGS